MFGVSLDGPQPVIVLEYCAGGIKSKIKLKSTSNTNLLQFLDLFM
jgi:hypothetical protein